MSSRRKFLTQGSLTAAAMLVTKPFTAVAAKLGPVTGFSFNNNGLVLAHTGNNFGAGQTQVIRDIHSLKQRSANLLMLHAGHKAPGTAGQAVYDASAYSGENCSIAANDYRIIYKGNIKTGVIAATNGKECSINRINELSACLKNEKNCQLVVCLSQLGYKTKEGLNDLELAEASTHLDVIIGDHAEDFTARPIIARNRNKAEVIINYTGEGGLAFRKIEIDFDADGQKNRAVLNRTV
jgi:hypothetical protein